MISKKPSATWSSPSAPRCWRWNKRKPTMSACATRWRSFAPAMRACAPNSARSKSGRRNWKAWARSWAVELTLAQQAARGLEGDKTELTSEVVAARAEIANLESQLAQETANGRALSEANQILIDHANSADKRIVELQSEGAFIREKLLLLENDKRSLQTALDQTLAEMSRLSRRLTESENGLTAARARLEQMDISLAAAENERVTLATARDEANERHQSEAYAMNLRLEALRSRAATAEKLLAEVRQTLGARTEDIRVLERKAVEATIARSATEKVVERLTAARDGLDTKTRELEQT